LEKSRKSLAVIPGLQTVSQWQSRLQPAHMLRKLKFAAATSWGINARFSIVTQSVDPESSDFGLIEEP
jgi:hypothetical protein